MDCRAVFVRKRREKKKIPILSSTRLPAYLLVYYQLNQRPWLSHNAPVIRNEKKTAFWSWWIVCCSLAPSSSWGWAGAATGVVWLSWLPVPCLIFRSKKKRERERMAWTRTQTAGVFVSTKPLFSLLVIFYFFCRRLWIQQTRCRRKVRESYHVVMKSRKQLEAQQRYKKEQEERQRIRNEELR